MDEHACFEGRTWGIQTTIFVNPNIGSCFFPIIVLLVNGFDKSLAGLRRIKPRLDDDIISAILPVKLKWFCSVLANIVQPVADNDIDAIERVRFEVIV